MQKNSQLFVLLVLVAFLLSFLGIVFFIVPRISSLKDLSNQVAAKDAELKAGIAEVQAIKAAVQLVASAQQSIQTLGIAVPEQARADEATVQISAAASKASISISSVTVASAENGYVNLTVSTVGSFDSTAAFISNLQNNLRPIKVIDFSIASGAEGSQLNSTFNLGFPYLPEVTTTSAETANSISAEIEPSATITGGTQ